MTIEEVSPNQMKSRSNEFLNDKKESYFVNTLQELLVFKHVLILQSHFKVQVIPGGIEINVKRIAFTLGLDLRCNSCGKLHNPLYMYI